MSVRQEHAQLALSLADRFRGLHVDRQIAALGEWRRTVADITRATKKARRAWAERHRLAKLQGRKLRREAAGISGILLEAFWGYVVEGAAAGAGRELGPADDPLLHEAFKRVEAKGLEAARTARGSRLRQLLASIQRSAVAIGYLHMRGSFGDIIGTSLVMPSAIGSERPETAVAVLALAELGHSHADIARGLDIDSAVVRREVRSARAATQNNPSATQTRPSD